MGLLLRLPFLLTLVAPALGAVDFNREVRPILAQHCFACHGMDEHGRKGGLRLDLQDQAHGSGKSGERAILPGKPAQSELMRRIESPDEDEVMPPPSTRKPLSQAQREVLRQWIAQGAKYEAHWAFTPPRPITPPALAPHPIDAFVRQRLKEKGLEPSPPADAGTLLRRLSLDLTGLPPTAEQLAAFQSDSSPKAYEAMVTQLLNSPRCGERWARRWLDLARYADTNGYEKDRPRPAWPWRDWVVNALNADMPFDQFSIAQLAGDLLPQAGPAELIATGFHRNTMLNEEGGIDPNEFRFYALVDRVAVTGTTWMGLTLGCTQCHTHKYDPIEHREFYGLMALLNQADEPTYFIPTPEVQAQEQAHASRLRQLEDQLPARYPGGATAMKTALEAWQKREAPRAAHWQVLRPKSMQSSMPTLKLQSDGFILGSGDSSKSDVYELELQADLKAATALRLEVASHPSLPNDGPGLTSYEGPIGGFFLSELQASQEGQALSLAQARASNEQEEDRISDSAAAAKSKAKAKGKARSKVNSAAAALDGEMSSGWQVLGGQGQYHSMVVTFAKPVDLSRGLKLRMLFEKHFSCPLGYFRWSASDDAQAQLTGHPAAIEDLLRRDQATLDPAQRAQLLQHFLISTPEMQQHAAPLLAARRNWPRGQPTLIMRARPADQQRKTHRHHRGEYLSPRELVAAGVPAVLPPLPKDRAADRLSFARWLFSPQHPLTARVSVNRHWQAFFGQGLVKSLEDFGYQSDPPTHPELLDWLALEFQRLGWSQKALHRLIVTSETYRQSSALTPKLQAQDPGNQWLARASRFRLEAEIIRDSTLQAAGLLSPKMGGPGVYPPQPASVTSEGTYGKVAWQTSQGEDRYRRSLYTFAKRTAPFALFNTFDAPSGEACLARREVSNSPLQALSLLNDEGMNEAAQALGKAIRKAHPGDKTAALKLLTQRVLSRPPELGEQETLIQFVENQQKNGLNGEAAWAALARVLFNLDETITHR